MASSAEVPPARTIDPADVRAAPLAAAASKVLLYSPAADARFLAPRSYMRHADDKPFVVYQLREGSAVPARLAQKGDYIVRCTAGYTHVMPEPAFRRHFAPHPEAEMYVVPRAADVRAAAYAGAPAVIAPCDYDPAWPACESCVAKPGDILVVKSCGSVVAMTQQRFRENYTLLD